MVVDRSALRCSGNIGVVEIQKHAVNNKVFCRARSPIAPGRDLGICYGRCKSSVGDDACIVPLGLCYIANYKICNCPL